MAMGEGKTIMECLTNKESSPSASEQLIDGMPAVKAFRHREVMLIQAIMEKYGPQLGGVSAEFLGAGPRGVRLTVMIGPICRFCAL